MVRESCDVVIVGGGIAGLSFALYLSEARPDVNILLLNKGEIPDTNTHLAQGGIAAVVDHGNDSIEQHKSDTLAAGGGLCDEKVVDFVVHEAPDRIQDLLDWGVQFDLNGKGFHLNREGGHTAHRILHQKDFTGKGIHQQLFLQVEQLKNVEIRTHSFVLEILKDRQSACGLVYYDELAKKYAKVYTKTILLATGGSGQLFPYTTNHEVATGDGVALAARTGARIQDLEYYQFHPTAMYSSETGRSFLVSEAVRGFGGYILNDLGERFLFNYDSRGELATRDVVTRAILREMSKKNVNHVYLSVKHLDVAEFKQQFPTIFLKCEEKGIDLEKKDIPVVPAAHYQCGGIKTNGSGQTTIERLYAVGECARTGLHGTNRLASNSLIEAVVFAKRSADSVAKNLDQWGFSQQDHNVNYRNPEPYLLDTEEQKQRLRQLMVSVYHGDTKGLEKAALQVREWKTELENTNFSYSRITGEYINLLEVAKLMIEAVISKERVYPEV